MDGWMDGWMICVWGGFPTDIFRQGDVSGWMDNMRFRGLPATLCLVWMDGGYLCRFSKKKIVFQAIWVDELKITG
jgi:hypothetical protein